MTDVKLDQVSIPFDLFEYNSYPIEEVQNIWFSKWVDFARKEFKQRVEQNGKKPITIANLAQLFKESYEVIIVIIFTQLKNILPRIVLLK